jgi:hypothetical protein
VQSAFVLQEIPVVAVDEHVLPTQWEVWHAFAHKELFPNMHPELS